MADLLAALRGLSGHRGAASSHPVILHLARVEQPPPERYRRRRPHQQSRTHWRAVANLARLGRPRHHRRAIPVVDVSLMLAIDRTRMALNSDLPALRAGNALKRSSSKTGEFRKGRRFLYNFVHNFRMGRPERTDR